MAAGDEGAAGLEAGLAKLRRDVEQDELGLPLVEQLKALREDVEKNDEAARLTADSAEAEAARLANSMESRYDEEVASSQVTGLAEEVPDSHSQTEDATFLLSIVRRCGNCSFRRQPRRRTMLPRCSNFMRPWPWQNAA